jgi:acyl-CoA reductase-like NAD-dependent aldehyde dehydrogenase
VSGEHRAALLRKLADGMDARNAALARLESENNGTPIAAARGLVASAAMFLRYFAGMADKLVGTTSTALAVRRGPRPPPPPPHTHTHSARWACAS